MRSRYWIIAILLILLAVPLAAVPASASPTSLACGPTVTYLVRPGDNLFRIALNHGTTMQAIASANGITNYARIFWGTTLRIPCAATTPPVYTPPVWQPPAYVPPVWVPPASDSNGILPPVYTVPSYYIPPIRVNCNQLYGTSPLSGMNYGDETFYWNPTPGATSYRVNVYSVDINPGRLVASADVPANRTHATLNMGSAAGPGFRFAWEVQAMVSDISVCTSQRYTMYRESP